ncbi:MAG: phosphodiester glycosidase family protein [Clostridiales bacterium]|nr:phosphodiester glycosidase family protein [Clostridiales bacterium]
MIIETLRPVFNARLFVNKTVYRDEFNLDEPYDRCAHIFRIPKDVFKSGAYPVFYCSGRFLRLIEKRSPFEFDVTSVKNEAELIENSDSKTEVETTETETLSDGLTYTHYFCRDKDSLPIHIFCLDADMKKVSLHVGTPNDGYKSRFVRQTIPDMAKAAEKNGVPVIAAVNADFFDIFGDFHPAGLCVKNGKVVANASSTRPFIGIKKDGTAVLTSLSEEPGILSELYSAVSGLQLILKDGEIYDVAAGEPFGYVRHPRTAAGIRKDGSIFIVEVDGRIPDYSNGASLTDLAVFMKAHGCVRALNLDGGGSSSVYTKTDGELLLRTNPADLFRPNDKLIRKEFNCILFYPRT